MKKILTFILAITLIGANCNNQQTHNLRPKPTEESTSYCKAAEINLLNVCPIYAQPTKSMIVNGETFADFCRDTQNNGIFLDPVCLSKCKNCAEASKCDGSSK